MKNHLGIDIKTVHAKKIMDFLENYVTEVAGPYPYKEDGDYAQIWVVTELSEEELEDLLYRTEDILYEGVFTRPQP